MKKSFFSFYKFNFVFTAKNILFLAILVLFSLFISTNFFIKNLFFDSNSTEFFLFFSSVPYICIICIPTLCNKMSFSIYNDFVPLNMFQKNLAIFLSKFTLFLIMILFLIPQVFCVSFFGNIDFGQIFTSFLFLIFYGSSVISFCLFVSVIFENKSLIFFVNAIFLSLFNSVHLLTFYFNLGDFFSSICKFLSFAWHFDAASKGIFDTRDFFWFIFVTIFFFLMMNLVIFIKKGKIFTKKQKLKIILIFFVPVLMILNSSVYFKRFDLSQNKTYSLSDYSKKITQKIDQSLKITYYISSSLVKLYPQIQDVKSLLIEFSSLNKNINLIIKNPDNDKNLQEILNNYGIKNEQSSAIILEYENKVQIIPFCFSALTLEYELLSKIQSLVFDKTRNLNIIIGNGMSVSKDFGYAIQWFTSQGFSCNPIFIEDPNFLTILENSTGTLLVIGDSQIDIEKSIGIESYILQEKGNCLFFVSPYSFDIENDWKISENSKMNIIEMLENWGIIFTPRIVGDISCARITMYSDDYSDSSVINYPLWINLLPQQNCLLGSTVFWSTSLKVEKNAQPLLISSENSFYLNIDKQNSKNFIETNPFELQNHSFSKNEKSSQIVASKIQGELKGYYTTFSSKNSKIYCVSDQYFLNNLMNGYIGNEYGDTRNYELATNFLLELNNEEELAKIHKKIGKNTSFYKIESEQDLQKAKKIIYCMIFIIIPFLQIILFLIINLQVKFYEKKR